MLWVVTVGETYGAIRAATSQCLLAAVAARGTLGGTAASDRKEACSEVVGRSSASAWLRNSVPSRGRDGYEGDSALDKKPPAVGCNL